MIVWKKATIKIRTTEIVKDINLEITKGKALGIIGSNGTGKTMLVKAIAGQIQVQGSEIIEQEGLKKVFVSFLSSFRMRNGFAAFRQQRWNNIDPDSVPTVKEELGYEKNKSSLDPLLEMFNFRQHIDKYVISLSNGEQRKLELIRAYHKSQMYWYSTMRIMVSTMHRGSYLPRCSTKWPTQNKHLY
jgi:ATPase subunit of ABC transporter with duplicated ATPase domains